MNKSLWSWCCASLLLLSQFSTVWGADLILNGNTVTLSGRQVYGTVRLTNGARINVTPYDGNIATTGILEIVCDTFYMDATSVISAKGAGYRARLCNWGEGPANVTDTNEEILLGYGGGGRGGCSVRDSGGGGGHFGTGGMGTKDCTTAGCLFPAKYEEVCVNCNPSGNACVGSECSSCPNYNDDGVPMDNGPKFQHSIYEVWGPQGMGAAGGDKGCRDGDGFTSTTQTKVLAGGNGGGRIIINATGLIEINGQVNADGHRGCGEGNDSGGGGAGGTIFIISPVGLNVSEATTVISARGGLGGDSQPKSDPECAGTQMGGTCDDCGGGGAGGLIYVKVPYDGTHGNFLDVDDLVVFPVAGGYGGACTVCRNEARGGDGFVVFWSKLEWCDGQDNTYDGEIDENLPTLDCGGTILPSCVNGVRQYCPSTTHDPTTAVVTTADPTTGAPTTGNPTTGTSTTGNPTTGSGTTAAAVITTGSSTTGAAATNTGSSETTTTTGNQGTATTSDTSASTDVSTVTTAAPNTGIPTDPSSNSGGATTEDEGAISDSVMVKATGLAVAAFVAAVLL